MKRLIALVFCLLLTVQFRAYAAAGQPTYSIDTNIAAVRGETVTVPIYVSSNPGFTTVGFVVTYNSSVLEISSVTAAQSAMPLNSQFALTTTPGTQWIHLINTNLSDWYGNGVVANIKFYVKSTAPTGTSPVYLSFTTTPDGTPANANSAILSDARVVSGSVNVSDTNNSANLSVFYNLNGGTGTAPYESNKAAGQVFLAASTVGITPPYGKQFKNWNTSPDGTGTWYWPGESITMPASSITLFAIWEDVPTGSNASSGNDMDVTYIGSDTGNSAKSDWLPQTGSMFWPAPLLSVFGALLLIPCCVLLKKKS